MIASHGKKNKGTNDQEFTTEGEKKNGRRQFNDTHERIKMLLMTRNQHAKMHGWNHTTSGALDFNI